MTDPAPTGAWRTATVRSIEHPSPHAVVLRLEVPDRIDHLPGQHYAIRLTADDGYVAQRSYSVASAPAEPLLEFYVERLDDGEVSSFLADVVEVGDELTVRGPIGGWFVWRADTPAFGLGGGSGAVPLVAMLRHARTVGRPELCVWRSPPEPVRTCPTPTSCSRTELLSRSPANRPAPAPPGRLTAAELAPLVPGTGPCFVCGSASFAEGADDLLTELGVQPARVRVERFGPTSG